MRRSIVRRAIVTMWASALMCTACGAGTSSTTSTVSPQPTTSDETVATTAAPRGDDDAGAVLGAGHWAAVTLSEERHSGIVVTTCADDRIVAFSDDDNATVVIDPRTGDVQSVDPVPIDVTHFETAKVWTDRELIVWGTTGDTPGNVRTVGASLDLATGTWRPIADDNRFAYGDAVWTGSSMTVVGAERGGDTVGAASYSPVDDRWTELPAPGTIDVPRPYKPDDMVWTGSWLLLPDTSGFHPSRRLDLATSTWSDAAISPLTDHTDPGFAWIGTRLIAQGGYIMRGDTGEVTAGAALYAPDADTWTTIDDPIGAGGGIFGSAGRWVIAQRGDEFIAWDPGTGETRNLAPAPWPPLWCAGSEYAVGLAQSDSATAGVLSLSRWTPDGNNVAPAPVVTFVATTTTLVDPSANGASAVPTTSAT